MCFDENWKKLHPLTGEVHSHGWVHEVKLQRCAYLLVCAYWNEACELLCKGP